MIRGSAVPSAYLFQLSAVPTVILGNMALTLLILSRSCCPLKFPRYSVSEPTVMASMMSSFPGTVLCSAAVSALNDSS